MSKEPWAFGSEAELIELARLNKMMNFILGEINKAYPKESEASTFDIIQAGCTMIAIAFFRLKITKCEDKDMDMLRSCIDVILKGIKQK